MTLASTPVTQHQPTKNYDSEFCGSIPIHLINLIQPHGVLLVLDSKELKIGQVSENVATVLGISASELLNQPLSDFVPASQLREIREKVSRWNVRSKIPVVLHFATPGRSADFNTVIHFRNDCIVLELEEISGQDENDFIRIYQEIKYIVAALKEAGSTEDITHIAAQEIKQLSGFDRVMLYRFDPNWNGIVVAEAMEEGMEPYLGLHFPASDVPRQTRELYFRNPYRLIPNRDAVPVKLIPVINPITRTFTDLSESSLRSVPNVHIEYLRNMDVAASMSTPIIIRNQLWGLISCHHRTPKYLSYEERSAFELLSNVLSGQLAARESEEDSRFQSELERINARLIEQMYIEKDFASGLTQPSTNLNDLLRTEGVAVVYGGEYKLLGRTPNLDQIRDLIGWLQLTRVDKLFATDNLSKMFARSEEYKEVASGLVALPISPKKGDYILGFRAELLQTVSWGGNPNQAINFEADGRTYHPRNSFSIWKETVKNTSLPWLARELEAAERLRTSVLERIVRDKL